MHLGVAGRAEERCVGRAVHVRPHTAERAAVHPFVGSLHFRRHVLFVLGGGEVVVEEEETVKMIGAAWCVLSRLVEYLKSRTRRREVVSLASRDLFPWPLLCVLLSRIVHIQISSGCG